MNYFVRIENGNERLLDVCVCIQIIFHMTQKSQESVVFAKLFRRSRRLRHVLIPRVTANKMSNERARMRASCVFIYRAMQHHASPSFRLDKSIRRLRSISLSLPTIFTGRITKFLRKKKGKKASLLYIFRISLA